MKENTDGRFRVEVVDGDGNVRIGDAHGNPLTIEGLVAEMKASETYAAAFASSGASGTGSSKTNSTSARTNGKVMSVDGSDLAGMSANLADIASGKVEVNMGQ